MQFGAFIDYLTTVNNQKMTIPKSLTERRFRAYWEKTSGRKDVPRFKSVTSAA